LGSKFLPLIEAYKKLRILWPDIVDKYIRILKAVYYMGKKRLFIIAEPRSGSSWLMKTLSSHNEIDLLSELYNHNVHKKVDEFHEIPDEKFIKCIDYLELKLSHINNRYIGCKILIPQFYRFNKNFAEYFIEHYKNAYFLILTRRNMIKCQVSLCVAHTYNKWHIKTINDLAIRKVELKLPHLIENLEAFNLFRKSIFYALEKFNAKYIHITYENLFKNINLNLNNICYFLGLSSNKFKNSNEVKGNPYKLNEIVENYEETKEYLRNYPKYYNML
jgi:LPS sulfotransferase NodH